MAPDALFHSIAADHPLSIVVAEDSSVNQLIVRRMLAKLGYRIDLVENGQELVEQFTKRRYDVVFMDVEMPIMNGLEATRALRKCTQFKRPWIIAMTATATSSAREQCIAEGMDDYLSKPINLRGMSDALLRAWAAIKGTGST